MIKQTLYADEVECTCIRFKGKKQPVCVGSNCNAKPAGTQDVLDTWLHYGYRA